MSADDEGGLQQIGPALLQWFADFKRERRINKLRDRCIAASKAGRRNESQALWRELRAEIMARSQQQVARMERGQGIR